MTEACPDVAGSEAEPAQPGHLYDRMPVILRRDGSEADLQGHRADWLHGAPDPAGLLCRRYTELMVCERTADRWARRR